MIVERYRKLDLVFRGHLGKWSWISCGINELSLELVFRRSQGKCCRISRRINKLFLELVFRGLEQ